MGLAGQTTCSHARVEEILLNVRILLLQPFLTGVAGNSVARRGDTIS